MEEATQLCDRLVIINEGQILAEGTPAALVERLVGYDVIEIRLSEEEEAIRPKVLEIIANRPIRYEEVGHDTLFLFGQQPRALRDLDLPPVNYQVARKAGLEDVFLRLTGRGLNE